MRKLLKWIEKNLGNRGYILLPLTWIEHDKQKHALFGIWVSGVAFMISNELLKSTFFSVIFGLLISLIIGILIEWYQKKFGKRTYDKNDILATFLGGVFSVTILLIIWLINDL